MIKRHYIVWKLDPNAYISFQFTEKLGEDGAEKAMTECLKWAGGRCVTWTFVAPAPNDKADPLGELGYVGCRLNTGKCRWPHSGLVPCAHGSLVVLMKMTASKYEKEARAAVDAVRAKPVKQTRRSKALH